MPLSGVQEAHGSHQGLFLLAAARVRSANMILVRSAAVVHSRNAWLQIRVRQKGQFEFRCQEHGTRIPDCHNRQLDLTSNIMVSIAYTGLEFATLWH